MSKKLAKALHRVVVTISGIMTTMTVILFTENLKSCMLVLLVGAIVINLIDESIR